MHNGSWFGNNDSEHYILLDHERGSIATTFVNGRICLLELRRNYERLTGRVEPPIRLVPKAGMRPYGRR